MRKRRFKCRIAAAVHSQFIGIVSVLALRETARRPLPGSAPCVARRAEAQDLIRRGVDEGRVRDGKFTPVGERA
ncbi:hypothetical protein WS45_05715 [Burkholderia sp. RF2-non_BP3]|nr:hypothetical protein WS45_05715 [Burkholderia sp. RF2-non_BP3]